MVTAGFFDGRFRSASLLVAGMLLLGVASGRSYAQEPGDAAAGRTLAEKWCSNCHVVTSSQQLGTSTGAPTFFAIARMKSITRLSLRVFFQTSHDRMPDLHLNTDEVDNVSTYILSLRRGS
jgi:mono/diheme cytochrome c family protein